MSLVCTMCDIVQVNGSSRTFVVNEDGFTFTTEFSCVEKGFRARISSILYNKKTKAVISLSI